MKLKWILLISVVALIIGFFVFTGCGSQGSSSSGEATSMKITNISPYAVNQ